MRDDEKTPRPERHDLEHADDVVDRRVIGALLVAIVEPVDPGQQDPEREGSHEERDLPDRRDAVGRRPWRNECKRHEICAKEPHDVGAEQQPPHEPTAPPP